MTESVSESFTAMKAEICEVVETSKSGTSEINQDSQVFKSRFTDMVRCLAENSEQLSKMMET